MRDDVRQHNLIERHRHIDSEGDRFERRFKGGVSVPGPTAEETALQNEQLQLLREQRAESDMYKPVLYQQNQLKEDVDPDTGKTYLRKMTEDEIVSSMTESEKKLYDIQRLQADRLQQAYEGKLPVSTALENDITERRSLLDATMATKLGGNWQTSTPGIKALEEFNKNADTLREQSRKGEIDSGTGLLLNQMGYLGDTRKTASALASNFGTGGTQLLNGYSQALQPYLANRQMQMQANMANAQNKSGLLGGIGQLAGIAAMVTPWGKLLGGGGTSAVTGSLSNGGGGGWGNFASTGSLGYPGIR